MCAAISIELAISGLFYAARIFVLPDLHPNFVLIAHFVRTQFTTSITLLLVFVPKFWYQQKQVRSLGQEYSCRLPVDAFKVNFIFLLTHKIIKIASSTSIMKDPFHGFNVHGYSIEYLLQLNYINLDKVYNFTLH